MQFGVEVDSPRRAGRLLARPRTRPLEAGAHGVSRLALDDARDGLLYVPDSYNADAGAPLVVALHGAGGNAHRMLDLLHHAADEHGVILLVPESRVQTWDLIASEFGIDVAYIDAALSKVFDAYRIDIPRIALAGFSDGASYALSLGLVNGDLFTHLIAFSPGFIAPSIRIGRPRIWIAHGVDDRVLPIAQCGRHVAPQLSRAGYVVEYNEFAGGHCVPGELADQAFGWLHEREH